MKLTEEQIWKCNNTINYEGGDVDAVHICLEHQNVVDFARSIEREIGFARAELWIKRINDAVEAEREACIKLVHEGTGEPVQTRTLLILQKDRKRIEDAILARGQA